MRANLRFMVIFGVTDMSQINTEFDELLTDAELKEIKRQEWFRRQHEEKDEAKELDTCEESEED